jgi:hypothetical protein
LKKENDVKRKLFFILLVIVLLASACMPSQEQVNQIVNSVEQTALAQVTVVGAPTQDVNSIVQATFQALTAQAVTSTPAAATFTPVTPASDVIPTFTPAGGQSGSISGTLSYPAEGLPAMAIVAFHVGGGTNDYYYVVTQQGQSNYQIDNLPAGNYEVIAYSLGGGGFPSGLAGGYTQFVPCGMQASCSDHTLINVIVNGGQVTGNINPQDWYAPDGAFPGNPLP